MQDKKSVLLYCDIIHTIEKLEDAEAGKLFKHYLRYINDLNPEAPDKLTEIIFEPIKQNLKRDLKKWEAKSQRNSEIAKASWEKRKDANAYERIKTDAKNADKDKVIVKDIISKDINKSKKTFFKDSDIFDKVKFKAAFPDWSKNKLAYYYDSVNTWSNEGNKKIDWKAAVRTWASRDEKQGKIKFEVKHTHVNLGGIV